MSCRATQLKIVSKDWTFHSARVSKHANRPTRKETVQHIFNTLGVHIFTSHVSPFLYAWVNSKSDHPSPPPPGKPLGIWLFLKMLDQIPRCMDRFQGQMPHWLGLKSQNFHNLPGIDERIVKEIFGSQSTGKITNQCISWIQNRYVLVLSILYSFKGFDKTLSAWLMLFCAERYISVVCVLPIILRRDNCADCAFID